MVRGRRRAAGLGSVVAGGAGGPSPAGQGRIVPAAGGAEWRPAGGPGQAAAVVLGAVPGGRLTGPCPPAQVHNLQELRRSASLATKVFVQRDYSDGTMCQFQTKFPPELDSRVGPLGRAGALGASACLPGRLVLWPLRPPVPPALPGQQGAGPWSAGTGVRVGAWLGVYVGGQGCAGCWGLARC